MNRKRAGSFRKKLNNFRKAWRLLMHKWPQPLRKRRKPREWSTLSGNSRLRAFKLSTKTNKLFWKECLKNKNLRNDRSEKRFNKKKCKLWICAMILKKRNSRSKIWKLSSKFTQSKSETLKMKKDNTSKRSKSSKTELKLTQLEGVRRIYKRKILTFNKNLNFP